MRFLSCFISFKSTLSRHFYCWHSSLSCTPILLFSITAFAHSIQLCEKQNESEDSDLELIYKKNEFFWCCSTYFWQRLPCASLLLRDLHAQSGDLPSILRMLHSSNWSWSSGSEEKKKRRDDEDGEKNYCEVSESFACQCSFCAYISHPDLCLLLFCARNRAAVRHEWNKIWKFNLRNKSA